MTIPDCLFCKIIHREIPATIIYEDEDILAFDDIMPKAQVHKLIVPKQHIATLNDLPDDLTIAGKLLHVAKKLAIELNIANSGYRTIINCGKHGGQEVFHLHLHLLGGEQL